MISLLLGLLLLPASGAVKDYIYSAGLGPTSVINETELRTRKGSDVLLFKPNIPSSLTFAVETKLIDLAYSFTSENASDPNRERSRYQDIRINGGAGPVDFRLNLQRYKGALVDEGGVEEFYKDYEVRSTNARGNYYFNQAYLRFVRDGHLLVQRVAKNKLVSTSGSWFLGLNADRRVITLPKDLDPAHEARVSAKGLDYDTHVKAFLIGPLAGGDGTLYLYRFFLRGKFGLGPAFVSGGTTLVQYEFAFSTGLVLAQRHLFSLSVDSYNVNFRPKNSELVSMNNQFALFYTYAFR